MNRPIPWVAVAFVTGLFLSAQREIVSPIVAAAFFLAAFLVALAVRRNRTAQSLALLACFAGSGALYWDARHLPSRNPSWPALAAIIRQSEAAPIAAEGVVRDPGLVLPGEDYLQFYLDAGQIGAAGGVTALDARLVVRWTGCGRPVFSGERVRVIGHIEAALGRANPGVRGTEDYRRRLGAVATLNCRGPAAVTSLAGPPPWCLPAWVERVRYAQMHRLAAAIPAAARRLVYAVWLGERSGITETENAAFTNTGTAHILSVSGVHIGIIFSSASVFLSLLTRRRVLKSLLLMAVVFLFALVTGASIPALRAAFMVALYLIADLLGRERDAPTALSIAALVFLVWSPDLLFDAGAQLSFLSLASILAFSEPITAALPYGPRVFRRGLATALSVQILPLPVALRTFHVLPLLSPVVNLLVVPLLSVVLWLTFLATLTSLVSRHIALLFGHALAPVVYAITAITHAATHVPGNHVNLTSPAAGAVFLYGIAVFLAVSALKRPLNRKLLAGAAAAFLAMCLCWHPLHQPAEVIVLDVGHGDAIFVRSPENQTLLVDGGDVSDFADQGRRTVLPFLRANHVSRLDHALVTHPDRDHIAGMISVLAEIPTGEVILGPRAAGRPLEDALLELCAARAIPVRRVANGDAIDLGGMTLDVLHPSRDWHSGGDVNNASVVTRLRWDEIRFLLTGDIEASGERALAGTQPAAEILKAPHHGSATSSSPALLDAVRPRVAIVSTGGPTGREPVAEVVLDAYRARGIPLYRTDWHGALRLTRCAGKIHVETERAIRGYPLVCAPESAEH